MREGSAEVVIACAAEQAFAWLADPRHAGEWFASVALPAAPEQPLRAGTAWRFSMTRQRGKSIPMRLAVYEPPRQFTWETTYPTWRDNLQWEFALTPEQGVQESADSAPAVRLRMTIRQRPGPVGWVALTLASALARLGMAHKANMAARAERAAQRAREALEAAPPPRASGSERRGDRRRKRS